MSGVHLGTVFACPPGMGVLIVSNRLPVTVRAKHGEEVRVERSAGGLATGMRGPHERSGGVWIGWPGDVSTLDDAQRHKLDADLHALGTVPVHLTPEQVERYYERFSNASLWPVFHYLLNRLSFHARDWDSYVEVNQRFADAVVAHYQPGDLVWVHDYQLLLCPAMIRKRLKNARIGLFLHIPFPSSEVFRLLPWRTQILEGMLGADLIGFHTHAYARHFANAVMRLIGIEPDVDELSHQGRRVRMCAMPMGIDAEHFATLSLAAQTDAHAIIERSAPCKIMLGVDRLDYTKGIRRRLMAFARLLRQHPELHGQIVLIQVAVPSRTNVAAYASFQRRVHQLVTQINGELGTATWTPIHYIQRALDEKEVAALYRAAAVMVVTPIRDGMNLVAKEYIAARTDEDGVLILSELAGAASELGEALLVNPYDIEQTAAAMARALAMAKDEEQVRMRAMRKRVFEHDVHHWARRFITTLEKVDAGGPDLDASDTATLASVRERIRAQPRVALLLDYDGTLVPTAESPDLARPDPALRALLRKLAVRMDVHVVSGRGAANMEEWLGDLPIGLSAEHGLWTRAAGAPSWTATQQVPSEWKGRVRPVLETFAERTPGTLIEEKSASLAWHYRAADAEFGALQAKELRLHLSGMLRHLPAEVLVGDKVVEVRVIGVDKGAIVASVRAASPDALLVAAGNDRTDEDLYRAVAPTGGLALHVGLYPAPATDARFATVQDLRAFLESLVS